MNYLDPRLFLSTANLPRRRTRVALLRRSSDGSITAISYWFDYADHRVASLRRLQGGSFAAIMEWHYSSDH